VLVSCFRFPLTIFMIPQIKICCIGSVEEAALALKFGADALGLVARMPSGPGPISDKQIEAIVQYLPGSVDTFLLTSEQSASAIINHVKRVKTTTVQIVDEITNGDFAEIKRALPNLKIVQVIHVNGEDCIKHAKAIEQKVDAILLDSGNPKATLKILGGTGNTHNWDISSALVKTVNIPVYLAGGLNASNVARAIRIVQPYGVDVCSGIRTGGKLDESKLLQFVNEVKKS
jgi:phosphoribosylanthranilate isomerase